MPPGFAAEDEYVRETLSVAEAYRASRLIRWPMREGLDEFWEKKEAEYISLRTGYEGLFDRAARHFVEANAHLLIDRQSPIGRTLVDRWETAPDANLFWRDRSATIAAGAAEMFQRVPRRLYEDGIAVTWAAMHTRLEQLCSRFPIYRELVQNIYFGIYMEEFDLRVITNAPMAKLSFGLATDRFYDYMFMESLIEPSGLWSCLLGMRPSDMVRLRAQPGYFEFRQGALTLSTSSLSNYEIRELAAVTKGDLPADALEVIEAETSGQLALDLGQPHTDEWIEAFAARLASASALALERFGQRQSELDRGRAGLSRARAALVRGRKGGPVRIAIFAALKEERQALTHRWQLSGDGLPARQWAGCLPDGTAVVVFSAPRMGRVPAAVSTASLLRSDEEFDLIVVVGVAGGFKSAGVELGAVLIPYVIADLASRKVDNGVERVRPDPYEVDQRLGQFLENKFGEAAWAQSAAADHGWPEGRVPYLRIGGQLACVDDVVADEVYQDKLLDGWDKLDGVEMEAGGVLAAARELSNGTPVVVIRSVTDFADPAKADTEWRRRVILTIASLIEGVEWGALVEP